MEETPDEMIDSIRSRLKARRGEFAAIIEMSGLSRSMISKIASGTRGDRASVQTITALQKALDALDAQPAVGTVDAQAT